MANGPETNEVAVGLIDIKEVDATEIEETVAEVEEIKAAEEVADDEVSENKTIMLLFLVQLATIYIIHFDINCFGLSIMFNSS